MLQEYWVLVKYDYGYGYDTPVAIFPVYPSINQLESFFSEEDQLSKQRIHELHEKSVSSGWELCSVPFWG